MTKFEIWKIARNGWGVSTDADSDFPIFTCVERAKNYAKAKAGKRRAVIVMLDVDGSQLSSHEIDADSAQ